MNCDVTLHCRWTDGDMNVHWLYPPQRDLTSELQRTGELQGDRHFITFLRNPVDRLVSEILWVKTHVLANLPRWHRGMTKWVWARTNLMQAVFDPRFAGNNRQTCFLACNTTDLGARLPLLPQYEALVPAAAAESAIKTKPIARPKYPPANIDRKRILEEAKANLLSLAFFGITEYPRESYELFIRTFQKYDEAQNSTIPAVLFQEHMISTVVNEGAIRHKKVPVQIVSLIRHLNDLDQDLYDWAVPIFRSRLEEARKRFGALKLPL